MIVQTLQCSVLLYPFSLAQSGFCICEMGRDKVRTTGYVVQGDRRYLVHRRKKFRQYYLKVWEPEEEIRGNKWVLCNLGKTLENLGWRHEVTGWFQETLDDPRGLHGVIETNRNKFKNFYDAIDELKEQGVLSFTTKRKPGFVRRESTNRFVFLYEPYEYSLSRFEVPTRHAVFQVYHHMK